MVRRGRTSIVREVKESLTAIDKIGQSKLEARKVGESGIHSTKQMVNTMSDCQNFVKWVRVEYGVKSIADLQEQHYINYIEYLREKGISKGHRMNVETSLRLLEKGFKKRLERFKDEPIYFFNGFVPEKRLEKYLGAENVLNRAYRADEIQKIRDNVSFEVLKAVDLMTYLGLRVKEAANIRVEHFVKMENGWRLIIYKGTGITKGGRFREVPVPVIFENRLESLLKDKRANERLVKVSVSTIRDGVNVACKKAGINQDKRGCHGFRHVYARERASQLMSVEQKEMMQRILENRKIGRKVNYGILSLKDNQIYKESKQIMDKIHGELGHGKNRWELAMRYLGE